MRFEEYIRQNLNKPFVWGEHDCITFAIGWLNIKSGQNFLEGLPAWDSVETAVRAIHTIGSLEEEFDRRLKAINPRLARDGDLTKIDRTAYLFSGSRIVGPDTNGLVFIDRMKAPCAWSL